MELFGQKFFIGIDPNFKLDYPSLKCIYYLLFGTIISM